MMNKHKAEDLIQKYAKGLCTPEERDLVESGFLSDFKNSDVNVSAEEVEVVSHRMFENINDHIVAAEAGHNRYTFFSRAIAVAASLLILAGLSWFFYENYQPGTKPNITYSNNIKPGGNKAFLTLSNGRRIELTNSANGEIASQSGVRITKTADGQVVYEITKQQKSDSDVPAYNTIETPKGGQFQVRLPDGTNVWLNAASSLRFPAAFTAKERSVELNGEAYFEVAKNKEKPFKVTSNKTTVEVLGTHFNIMAYNDEGANQITLLEGSVKVANAAEKATLIPGQQATISHAGPSSILINNDANLEEVIAWKNGYFMFLNEPVESIMRKISRWYNVEIVYQDKLQNKALWGTMSRFQNVSEVLKRLELTGVVHFKIDVKPNQERRIIVMK